jgi:hypothetical protein
MTVKTLSQCIEETGSKADTLLADLVFMVGKKSVAEDPEFLLALECALLAAAKSAGAMNAEAELVKLNGSRPRETVRL